MKSRRSLLVLLLLLVFLCSSCSAAASASNDPLSCLSCVFYKHMAMPLNNPDCASGRRVRLEPCGDGHACKVAFLQDASSTIVHAARSCQRSSGGGSQLPDFASLMFNARTTMYCNSSGCNNNWLGSGETGARRRLHCWVGHGRRIDQFQLQPCSDRVLELTNAVNDSRAGGKLVQTPVCLLAQLTRQIKYNGRAFESAMYLADCMPHASSVYGRNYPMFEYERVCRHPGCNSGQAAPKLQAGLMLAAEPAAGGTSAAAVYYWIAAALATAWLAADTVLL
ncbi:hypothetical protein BOX15_Mlig015613g1 [Macrostomum lignano]|uniref:UPAR/Ly6 domain-containing protein n=1 Tax=Macrostomum lignano TaxID=282301 RepID=A0A267DJF0_9PLAT|nr:hypothetical protein BOX15_Mlig015613g1 [Macrostomum lignano]